MQPGVDPEKPNQTQFYGQPQNINQQIQQTQGVFPQQQIIILNPKFQPKFPATLLVLLQWPWQLAQQLFAKILKFQNFNF